MNLKYQKVTNDNWEIAFNIQKILWPNTPDYNNFIDKSNNSKDDYISFIVYNNNTPVGITGFYVENIDKKTIWLDWFGILPEFRNQGLGKKVLINTINYCKKLNKFEYFRAETTFWEGRPAISLYDDVMHFKEHYTIEGQNNSLIYTFSFNGEKELWNNRYLDLNQYYGQLKD